MKYFERIKLQSSRPLRIILLTDLNRPHHPPRMISFLAWLAIAAIPFSAVKISVDFVELFWKNDCLKSCAVATCLRLQPVSSLIPPVAGIRADLKITKHVPTPNINKKFSDNHTRQECGAHTKTDVISAVHVAFLNRTSCLTSMNVVMCFIAHN